MSRKSGVNPGGRVRVRPDPLVDGCGRADPNEDTVDALVETVRHLLHGEEARADSPSGRATGLAGFVDRKTRWLRRAYGLLVCGLALVAAEATIMGLQRGDVI